MSEDKYRDSGRLAQIQIFAEHLRKESTGLIDLIESSQIEIRDVGRHAVQRTMQVHSDEANTRAIIDAMLSSPMCVHTQEIGCTTLLALCQGNDKDEVMYRIAQSNGIKAVTAAMDLLIVRNSKIPCDAICYFDEITFLMADISAGQAYCARVRVCYYVRAGCQ